MLKKLLIIPALSVSIYAINCDNAQNTIEMQQCQKQNYNIVNQKLTKVYKNLLKELDDKGQEKLEISQEKWKQFRDSQAKFSADFARGSSASSIYYMDEAIRLTKQRIKDLEATLSSLENM